MERSSSNLVKTSITLYETDVKELNDRGLSVSGTLRELIHHICSHNAHDIFYSIRRGQASENLLLVNSRILELKKQRASIDEELSEMERRRTQVIEREEKIEKEIAEAELVARVCSIGSVIDTMIFQYDFDIQKIKEADIPEIEEMERINPGWTLEYHVDLKKKLLHMLK